MTDLSALELSEDIVERIQCSKLQDCSTEQFLTYTVNDLRHACMLSRDEAKLVISKAAALRLRLAPATAWSILQGESQEWASRTQCVTTGDVTIDAFLRGGFVCQGISEVCGESSAGKTQLCLQLCLTVQLNSAGGVADDGKLNTPSAALYISTEDAFPHKRLAQLAEHFSRKHGNRSWMNHVFVEHALTYEDLEKVVFERLPRLASSRQVRVVIIDSMAAVSRAEFGLGEEAMRAHCLCGLALRLRQYSMEYGLAVVIINQVSAVMDAGQDAIQPALGLAWADMITTRILMSRLTPANALPADVEGACKVNPIVRRRLQVLFSPSLSNTASVDFVVEEAGLRGLSEPE